MEEITQCIPDKYPTQQDGNCKFYKRSACRLGDRLHRALFLCMCQNKNNMGTCGKRDWNESSSSNWILMSCQPHRVTSGQSNSGHKQIHISKRFPHIYQPSVKSIYKTNHFTNIKHTHTKTQIFEELVPLILPLLKEHVRLGHAGIADHSV